MGVDRLLFGPPQESTVSVERVATDRTCPTCGSSDVARYPVANFIGPRMVVKCQECFTHLETTVPTADDHWPPWASATSDWPASRNG